MGPILAWQPLPLELIKLNFDAALINNEAAIAVVARNDRGELLMAQTKSKRLNTNDPTIAKAAPILWAIELAKAEGFSKVIIESDAKLCIETLNDLSDDQDWKIKTLCSDSKSLISYIFQYFFLLG